MAIVYALESKGGIRGTVVDAYGVYSDPAVSAVLADIPIQETAAVGPQRYCDESDPTPHAPHRFSPGLVGRLQAGPRDGQGNHAELILVHVMSPAMLPMAEDSYVSPKVYKDLEAAARVSAEKHLNRLVAKAQQAGVRVKGLLLEGIPHERIARAARSKKTDLVVIGTTGAPGSPSSSSAAWQAASWRSRLVRSLRSAGSRTVAGALAGFSLRPGLLITGIPLGYPNKISRRT